MLRLLQVTTVTVLPLVTSSLRLRCWVLLAALLQLLDRTAFDVDDDDDAAAEIGSCV